ESEVAAKEHGIPVTFMATRGDSFAELRRIAQEVCADAVVVGASAKAGHRLVGSLAVRLVRAGKWPVTVVASPGRRLPHPAPPPPPRPARRGRRRTGSHRLARVAR